ncbi:MAG: HEAT repeat domain-containing protein, partial [Elusimicrobiota bacterium]
YIGGITYCTLEGFYRVLPGHEGSDNLHLFFGINLRIAEKISLGFGLSELTKALLPKAPRSIFELFPDDPYSNGYHAPGFWVSVHFASVYTKGRQFVDYKKAAEEAEQENIKILDQYNVLRDSIAKLLTIINENPITSAESIASNVPEKEMQAQINNAVAKLDRALSTPESYDPKELNEASHAIVQYGKRAIPTLKKLINNPNSRDNAKITAISLLGKIQFLESKLALFEVLNYESEDCQREAIIALGHFKNDPEISKKIEEKLSSKNPEIVFVAQNILNIISGKQVNMTKFTTDSASVKKSILIQPLKADSAGLGRPSLPADTSKSKESKNDMIDVDSLKAP